MRLFLMVVGFFLFSNIIGQIEIDGTFQGENLYVNNPFAPSAVGFCVYEVTVNGATTSDEIHSSAFEIDLSRYGFRRGDPVKVRIFHKENCMPEVINPEVLNASATFRITSLSVDDSVIEWTTTNESGSLPFVVEQFRWNKWVEVARVDGEGVAGEHYYSATVRMHSGENRFRIRQQDSNNNRRYSSEVVYKSSKRAVDYQVVDSVVLFTSPTMYELYDPFGRIVMRGYGESLPLTDLDKESYYLNYDNIMSQFSL
ncbi:hypothetical protein QA597_03970 [Marinilabiliaceae bacterium ANBcel2]|nr:hypothetical protein [Marinilabiliaceae bacterium ANBcel2]